MILLVSVLLGDVTQQPHPYVDDSNESSRVILSLRGITQSTETRNEVTLEIGIHQDLNYNTTQETSLTGATASTATGNTNTKGRRKRTTTTSRKRLRDGKVPLPSSLFSPSPSPHPPSRYDEGTAAATGRVEFRIAVYT
jgi:hypothetical protein